MCSAIPIRREFPVSSFFEAMIPHMNEKTNLSSLKYLSSVKTSVKTIFPWII